MNPFPQLLSCTISTKAAAKRIVSSNLKRLDNTAWRLWQLIFDAAAELPQYPDTVIELLLALQTQHEDATDGPELTAWIRKFGSS
ncbi:hypothetical protein MPH_04769 [Macrophomina phaseolina MS6]|uniref:Uncharacterized protein n=1 Tax=Macrophomina phaseolina (strain MS6) TaxID=1126212 RepID=K2S6P2_MACPH|nr:hypothetical protein MPH_04769 [Macrophomina phaseolina MS6]